MGEQRTPRSHMATGLDKQSKTWLLSVEFIPETVKSRTYVHMLPTDLNTIN
jgi:hypothetical protein